MTDEEKIALRVARKWLRELCAVVIVISAAPLSIFLFAHYIDEPLVEPLGSGVIFDGLRLLETAACFGIMFSLYLLARKLCPDISRM